ncbi:MAG: hypothetical protein LUG50_14465, partial [Planctomycetaceae bacterium]|nr:hypothetical protein [Planctomycetaceae bacterium]
MALPASELFSVKVEKFRAEYVLRITCTFVARAPSVRRRFFVDFRRTGNPFRQRMDADKFLFGQAMPHYRR